jgi:hypothetical protein
MNIGRHPRRQCPYHKDMRHTLQNYRDFKHSVGNGRPFQPLPPPTTRRTRRTSTTPAAGRGRRRSIPTHQQRSQRHLRWTRVVREQEAIEAQRPSDTGGGHQSSRPISMVQTPDHLHSGGSVAQLRPSGQIPAPRRSGDPREQGKEGVSGRGSNINVTFPRTLLGLGVALKELHRHSFLRHCAD